MKKSLPHLMAIISVLLVTAAANAQKRSVKGYIKDSATRQPVTNVLITDAFAKILGRTDSKGYFSTPLKEGQTIFFDAPNYHFDTLRLATMTPDTVTLYMAQLPNELASITVTTIGYSKYQHDSLKRRQAFVDDAGKKEPTFAESNSGAGIALNLDPFFEKKRLDQKKAYRQFDEIEQTNYVDYRFPRDLVASYTGLQGDDLSVFIEKYRPTYEWLRVHTSDEEVFLYVNDKLKKYLKKKK